VIGRINSLIANANFRAGVEPTSPPALAVASAQPQNRQTASTHPENALSIYKYFLCRSQLIAEKNRPLVDLIDTIFRDESVQRAAGACAAKRLRLTELAGVRSEISAAIEVAIANDEALDIVNIRPAMVAEVLRQRAEDIDDAISDRQEDRTLHDAASRARIARHKPLRDAVSKLLNDLVAERDRLIKADEAAARAAAMGLPTRYSTLISAGLSPAQIQATEPNALAPEVLIHRRRARLAEVVPQISKLQAFGASATFDAALLSDFPEFAGLIAARDGNDGVKACL